MEAAAALLTQWGVEVAKFSASDLIQRTDVEPALERPRSRSKFTVPLSKITVMPNSEYLCISLHSHQYQPTRCAIYHMDNRSGLAKEGGGAILISRDEVHAHQRGSAEADAAKLHRAKTFDEALIAWGRQSRRCFSHICTVQNLNDLKSAGLPVPEELPAGRFSVCCLSLAKKGMRIRI